VSTVAAITAEGSAQARDGLHHCCGNVGRSGNLDHTVDFGT
jgi:hypothetical protein